MTAKHTQTAARVQETQQTHCSRQEGHTIICKSGMVIREQVIEKLVKGRGMKG